MPVVGAVEAGDIVVEVLLEEGERGEGPAAVVPVVQKRVEAEEGGAIGEVRATSWREEGGKPNPGSFKDEDGAFLRVVPECECTEDNPNEHISRAEQACNTGEGKRNAEVLAFTAEPATAGSPGPGPGAQRDRGDGGLHRAGEGARCAEPLPCRPAAKKEGNPADLGTPEHAGEARGRPVAHGCGESLEELRGEDKKR